MTFTVGLVQMTSTENVEDNVSVATSLIREAHSKGAGFILTPEMTTLLGENRKRLSERIFTEDEDPNIKHFAALSHDFGIWLNIGSMPISVPTSNGDKIANRSFVFSPEGKVVSTYDKIHMFDVDLPNGEKYRESNAYEAGKEVKIVDTAYGKVGLSICYDLRFPNLYKYLSMNGAEMIAVPAAFTKLTGNAHWEVLLRARAIENSAFIFAPAQVGCHTDKRITYGHSMIVNPWGRILADGGEEIGTVTAEIDLNEVKLARAQLGNLNIDKKIDHNGIME